jgi:glycerol-3-phosphate dehydrogenase
MKSRYDLLIVGGGVNGASIARDAAGRGLEVLLVERGDLAEATSSASSKLIHGGLRYLEQYKFRLVREALEEREVLLRTAPHIVYPLRFVLPHRAGMRPAWMIRLGLGLYDRLGGRRTLQGSERVDLADPAWNGGRDIKAETGFAYTDCAVDDSRLVVLAAVDAARNGAEIQTRTRLTGLRRSGEDWIGTLAGAAGEPVEVAARAVVNAAGPWADHVRAAVDGARAVRRLRLVKGSHIVVPRFYAGDHAFILSHDDGRVVFAIPYAGRYSLIGTTDVGVEKPDGNRAPSAEEIVYLCDVVNDYFGPVTGSEQVVWGYAGVRALYDDGKSDPASVTRDYVLDLDTGEGGKAAPMLSVFGGKITTSRRLAERAMKRLAPYFRDLGPDWTAETPLAGGDTGPIEAFVRVLSLKHPNFDKDWLKGLAQRHGTRAYSILNDVGAPADLGAWFGAGLTAHEVDWLVRCEWARTAEDILWRRTKFGLGMAPEEAKKLEKYLANSLVDA